jgi:GNAT superfamily N-acetyltransferase
MPLPLRFPPQLTDTSPEGLRAAIEADVVATRLSNVDVPVEPHLEPDAAWAVAPDPESMRSVVVRAQFTTETADTRINEILSEIDATGSATLWWLAAHHGPPDLRARLIARGFHPVGDTAAMARPLPGLPPIDQPEALEIRPVGDEADVVDYVGVILADRPEGAPPTGAAGAELRIRHVTSRIALDPAPMRFVGRMDGRAVGTSRLSVVGGVAGVYGVVTVPDARGRGVGRAMTLTALHAGVALGMQIATLQATELGLPVYRRLGFEEYYRYELLARSAPR